MVISLITNATAISAISDEIAPPNLDNAEIFDQIYQTAVDHCTYSLYSSNNIADIQYVTYKDINGNNWKSPSYPIPADIVVKDLKENESAVGYIFKIDPKTAIPVANGDRGDGPYDASFPPTNGIVCGTFSVRYYTRVVDSIYQPGTSDVEKRIDSFSFNLYTTDSKISITNVDAIYTAAQLLGHISVIKAAKGLPPKTTNYPTTSLPWIVDRTGSTNVANVCLTANLSNGSKVELNPGNIINNHI